MAEETAFGIHFACVQEAKASRCASVHGTRRVGCGLFMGGILFFKASGLSSSRFYIKGHNLCNNYVSFRQIINV